MARFTIQIHNFSLEAEGSSSPIRWDLEELAISINNLNREGLSKEEWAEEIKQSGIEIIAPPEPAVRSQLLSDIGEVTEASLLTKIKEARLAIKAAREVVAEAPAKVKDIADAIRRDNPSISDEVAYRMAYETYVSYVNPKYSGGTEKGKSHRKSPKSEYANKK